VETRVRRRILSGDRIHWAVTRAEKEETTWRSRNLPHDQKASRTWEHLEDFVREHVQQFIQALLEEEVTELLGRTKSVLKEAVDAAPGYRNGYGKPQRLTLTNGTITVRRPRVHDLNERFVSRVLPLFKRQIKEVGELLPQLYLHGLALGDFELALRGVLGDSAPLSPASLLILKVQWQ
jgi:putative transposase